MRVTGGAAVAGEMLGAGEHVVLSVRADELRRVAGNGLGVGGEGAALALDDRIVGVGIKIHDRREVQIEADTGERLRGGGGVAVGFRRLIKPAEFLVGDARGKSIRGLQAVHAAAFLVDRGEQGNPGLRLQMREQRADLRG